MSESSLSDRLRDDQDPLRDILRAARSWSVPLSVFLGREVVTTHEHDSAGRLVRSTQQPLWTAEDREAALALAAYEASLCSGCGDPLAETTKPEHEDAYVPKAAIRCHRCAAAVRGQDRYRDDPYASSLMVPVVFEP